MATGAANGTNRTALAAVVANTLMDYGKIAGKMCFTYDILTAAQQFDAASEFTMGKALPIEAVPLFGIVKFTGSSTATLLVGKTGDTNLFGTATALTTTPIQVIMPTVPNTPLTAAVDILVTTATAAIVTSEVLELVIVYAMP